MAKVELKKPVIDEISNVIADADGVVLVNYSGLTVAQDTELRRTLREAGIAYKVYKKHDDEFRVPGNSLRRALQTSGRNQRSGCF